MRKNTHKLRLLFTIFLIALAITVNAQINNAPVAGFGSSVEFDGADDFIDIPNYPSPTGNFTIEFWVKPTNLQAGWKGFYGFNTGENVTRSPSMWQNGTKWVVDSYSLSGTSYYIEMHDVFNETGEWIHLAWVKEGTVYRFYRNGIQLVGFKSDQTNLGLTPAAPANGDYVTHNSLWIGKNGNYFDAFYDDVRIWNIARTQQEILEYQYRSLLDMTSFPNLVAYWAMDNGTGLIASDIKGSADGTLENGVLWRDAGTAPALTTNEDVAISAYLKASDADADPLSFILVNEADLDGTVVIDDELTGAYTFTPDLEFSGTTSFTYKVDDGNEDSANTATIEINVTSVNDTPLITSTAGTAATEDTQYTYNATVLDADDANNGVDLTWSLTNKPTGMSVNSTGVITWTPLNGVTTSGAVTLTVADGGEDSAAADTEIFTVTVTAVNDEPNITSTAGTTATEDTQYTYTTVVTDIDDANDGTQLTYVLANEPTGMSVSSTGTITWTPANGVASSGAVTLTVSDGGEDSAAADTEIFTITVTAVNDAPSITSTAGTTAIEDIQYTYTPTVTDVDDANNGTDLTWSLTNKPDGMEISSTGEITWTPADGVITGAVTITVADGGENSAVAAQQTFTIAVTPVEYTPVITEGSAQTVTMSEDGTPTAFALTLNATDDDPTDTITWSISSPATNGTASASGTGASKAITYTPDENWSGTDTFNVTVTDVLGATDVITVSVIIEPIVDEVNAYLASENIYLGSTVPSGGGAPLLDIDYVTAVTTFSAATSGITFDITDHEEQNIGGNIAANHWNITNVTASSFDDEVSLGVVSNGEVYTINGGSGNDVINFYNYSSSLITITTVRNTNNGTAVIDLGGGQSATVNYSNIESFAFNKNVFDGSPHGAFYNNDVAGWVHSGKNITIDTEADDADFRYVALEYNGTFNLNFNLSAQIKMRTGTGSGPWFNGIIIFDFQDSNNYKMAQVGAGSKSWSFFEFTNGVLSAELAKFTDNNIAKDVWTNIEVRVTGADGKTAQIWQGGAQKLTYTFDDVLNDGKIGVGGRKTLTDFIISLSPSNWAPYVTDYNYLLDVNAYENHTFNLVADAFDNEGGTLSIKTLGTPSHGTIVNNGDGTVTYTPEEGFEGVDSLTYAITDGTNNVNGKIRINVVNQVSLTVIEDGSFTSGIYTNLQDKDGSETLTHTIIDIPLGMQFSDGTNTYTATTDNGTLDVSAWGRDLTITLPADYTTAFKLKVTSVITEAINGALITSTNDLADVTITAVNDGPTITSTAGTTATEDIVYTYTTTVTDVDDANNGTDLTYALTNAPTGMVVSNIGVITWTPLNGVSSSGTVTLTVADGGEDNAVADTEIFTVAVTAVNDAPSITSTAGTSATEDIEYTYTTAVTDVDDANDGIQLTYTLTNAPTGMVVSATGVITWTPLNGVTTSGAVTLTVADGGEDSAAADTEIFTVSVIAVNDGPTITSTAGTTATEDIEYTYTTTVTDVDDANDGIQLTYTLSNAPTGMVVSSTGVIIWTPLEGVLTSGAVTLTVADDGEDSAAADTETFTVTVTPVNDAPLAFAESYSLNEGQLLTVNIANGILANDTDQDRDALGNQIDVLEAVLITGPEHGSLTLNLSDGSFTYQHDGSNETSDSFTYKASDGLNFSNTVTVTFNITEINDIPIANEDTYVLDEAATLVLDLLANDTDSDGEVLSIEIVIPPTDGTLTNAGSTVTYVHGGSHDSFDSFTYRIQDSRGAWSDPTLVDLNINLLNDAPVANNDGVFDVLEDSGANSLIVLANDTDEESSATAPDLQVSRSSIRIVSQPDHGSASIEINTGRLSYTPASNYVGTDAFTYTVRDLGGAVSNSATVSINVTGVDDNPNTTDDIVNLGLADIATPVDIDVLANDDNSLENDIDINSLSIVQVPTNGSASVVSGQIRYTPNNNSVTSDFLQYTISDNARHLSAATNVYINLTDPANQPLVIDDVYANDETDGTTTYTYDVLINDTRNGTTFDLSTLTILSPPAHGTATVNAGKIEYTPTAQYVGDDNFTYTVKTDNGIVALGLNGTGALVSITLNNVASAAFATNDDATDVIIGSTTYINVVGNDTDPDTDDILSENHIVIGTVTGGTATVVDGMIAFVSDPAFTGTPTIEYSLVDNNDNSLVSNTATVTISTVENHTPIAYDQHLHMPEDTSLEIVLQAFDVEGDDLTWSVSIAPNLETVAGVDNVEVIHGAISGTPPNITYTPEANYFILIADDAGTGNHDGHDHSNHVSLIFTVTDAAGNTSEQAVIEIGVTGVQDPPVIHSAGLNDALNNIAESDDVSSLNIKVYEDEVIDLSGVIYNQNVDVYDYLTWALLTAPTNGLADVSGYSQGIWDTDVDKQIVRPATFSYTPSDNFNGNDAFVARVYDPYLNQDQITINVEIIAVNDAPIIASTAPTTATEDILYTYISEVSDVDDVNNGVDLTYTLTNAPIGMLVSNTGAVTWMPLEGVLTSEEVTLTVKDGEEDGAVPSTENFIIAVTPVNDAPIITSIAPTTATEDVLYTYSSVVIDVDDANDGTALTYSLINAPIGMVVSTTGVVTWTPLEGVTTSEAVTLTVADGGEDSAAADTEIFTITVTPVNDAPVITSTAGTIATEDVKYTYTTAVTDVDDTNDGTALTYSFTNAPIGMVVNTTGVITWTPLNGVDTSGEVTLIVADGGEDGAIADTEIFTITVTPVNDAPVITNTAGTTATEDVLYTYSSVVIDVDDTNDGTALTYSLTNAPTGMVVSTTGVVIWTPLEGVTTSEAVTLTVADGGEDSAAADTEIFTITVTPVNDAPVITSTAGTIATEDVLYTYSSVVIDVDDVNNGVDLTYTLTDAPTGMVVSSTGVITWTPLNGVLTSGLVTLTVADGGEDSAAADIEIFTITVTPVNDAPIIVSTAPTTATEDILYTYTSEVNDVDDVNNGVDLTYTLTNAPTGMVVSSTGVITWMPLEGVLTSGVVTLTVTDGGEDSAAANTENFTITVTPVNDAPIITQGGFIVMNDVICSYSEITLNATDAENDELTWSFGTNPSHGTVEFTTGSTLTYVPEEGNYTPVSFFVIVTDDSGLTDEIAISATIIEDVTLPVVEVQNITVQLDANGSAIISASEIDTGSNDNCGIETSVLDITNFDCSDIGDNTVRLTITDKNGNSVFADVIVTVQDITAPLADISSLALVNEECSATLSTPTATDNCNGTIAATTTSIFPLSVSETVIWTYTDANGNSSTQTQEVIIEDLTNPEIVCPSDISLTVSDNKQVFVVQGTELNPLDYSDNCLVATISNDLNNTNTLEGETIDLGTTNITWIVEDNSGIISTCSFELTIKPEEVVTLNGFSPNGDGVNDLFVFKGLFLYEKTKLTIYNRWGNKVFEASPYNNDWDGTNQARNSLGNKLPVGTYFYILEIDGKAQKGYVYINR